MPVLPIPSVFHPMRLLAVIASAVIASGCTTTTPMLPVATIGAPPASLKLPGFYKRSLDAGGIPVSSSAKVADATLRMSAALVTEMLAHSPDVKRALIARGQRVVILAQDEGTLDLPELNGWKKPTRDDPSLNPCQRKHYDAWIGPLTDAQYWNWRARGLGGVMVVGASENVLGVPGTQYYGENILVHEFAHAILDGVESADPALYRTIQAAYAAAHAKGLWRGEYGDTNVQEYWAEGSQFWFESNLLVVEKGERILSAADLARHDPALATALRRVYGPRHHLRDDIFWSHPARVPATAQPAGTPPADTALVC